MVGVGFGKQCHVMVMVYKKENGMKMKDSRTATFTSIVKD